MNKFQLFLFTNYISHYSLEGNNVSNFNSKNCKKVLREALSKEQKDFGAIATNGFLRPSETSSCNIARAHAHVGLLTASKQ